MFHLLQDQDEVFVFVCDSDDVLRSTGRSSQLTLLASFDDELAAQKAADVFKYGLEEGIRKAARALSEYPEAASLLWDTLN